MGGMTADVHEPLQGPWVPADTFAARLLLARREKGLNYRQAAALCGLSYTTWRTWERGVLPNDMPAAVDAIARGLGCDRDWLMWGGPLVQLPFHASRNKRLRTRGLFPDQALVA